MLRVQPTPKYWSHSQSQLLVIVQIRNQFFIYYFSVYFSSLPFFAASLLTGYFACWCRHHFARSSRLRFPYCHCRRWCFWCCFSFIFLHSKLSHANFVMHSYFVHIFFVIGFPSLGGLLDRFAFFSLSSSVRHEYIFHFHEHQHNQMLLSAPILYDICFRNLFFLYLVLTLSPHDSADGCVWFSFLLDRGSRITWNMSTTI